jgi:hypothetical protein
MATVALDTLLPEISPIVPGCPEPVILNAVRTALTEFCTRSLFWKERLVPVSVQSGDFPYTIPAPAHGQFARVLSAHAGEVELHATSYDALDRNSDWDSKTGTPYHYVITPNRQLVVYPKPESAINLRLTVAYTALPTATVMEDFLFDRWRYALASGALKLLYAMPDKGWSHPDLAPYHANRFEVAIKDAFIEGRVANMARGTLSVTQRPFA